MTDAGTLDAGPARAPNAPHMVRCESCEFLWYGSTAAHGLSIIGHCPRCGGRLQFRDEGDGSSIVASGRVELDLEPAQVLGLPQTWGR